MCELPQLTPVTVQGLSTSPSAMVVPGAGRCSQAYIDLGDLLRAGEPQKSRSRMFAKYSRPIYKLFNRDW